MPNREPSSTKAPQPASNSEPNANLEGLVLEDYLSVREFLQDYYNRRKQRQDWFSYRFWGKSIGMDAGYLVKVLKGDYKFPAKYLPALGKFLRLGKNQLRFLEKLVEFEKSRTPAQTRERFQELLKLKNSKQITVQEDTYVYFSQWQMPAIRSLIELENFGNDYKRLGQKLNPPLSAAKTKDAVMLLQRLKLIEQRDDGSWIACERQLSTGESWQSSAIEEFQRQVFHLGEECITRFPKDKRDISSLTFTIREDQLEELREMIRSFRETLVNWISEHSGQSKVMQMNLQCFPLSEECEGSKND